MRNYRKGSENLQKKKKKKYDQGEFSGRKKIGTRTLAAPNSSQNPLKFATQRLQHPEHDVQRCSWIMLQAFVPAKKLLHSRQERGKADLW